VLRVAAIEVRTGIEKLLGLRVDPDPAETVDAGEEVLSSLLLPAPQISRRSVKMPAKALATLSTL
jgi:hypothetical protein